MKDIYRLKSPLAAQVEITDKCNFSCTHCYNHWNYDNQVVNKVNYPLEHFEEIIGILLDNGVTSITLTGGEPFLEEDILFGLVSMIKTKGGGVRINTNGSIITPSHIDLLAKSNINSVLLSFPSIDEKTYETVTNATNSFHDSIQTIKNLVDKKINTQINIVCTNKNIGYLKATSEYLKGLGVKYIFATPVLPCPNANEHSNLVLSPQEIRNMLDVLLYMKSLGIKVDVLEPLVHCMFSKEEREKYRDFLVNRGCSAGISDIAISPNGDIRACILSENIEGNILTEEWSALWEKVAYWGSKDMLPEECHTCSLATDCGGGCRVAAKTITGTFSGRDPYMTQAVKEELNNINNESQMVILPEDELELEENIKIRLEKFGGVVHDFRGAYMFLTPDALEFVQYLIAEKQSFVVSTLAVECSLEISDLVYFLDGLHLNGLIKKINKTKENVCLV